MARTGGGAQRDQAEAAAAIALRAVRLAGEESVEPRIVDVWSRTQPKYRLRAVLLLLINAGLFAGLNIFAFWLHHAKLVDFSWDSYVRAVLGMSLLDFVQYPVSVEQVPLMVVILGLTVGVMIAVPIVVAQLYRFPASLLFTAQVLLLGHLPTLAGFLLLSGYIAGGQRLRLSFRFASTALGLIPIVVYFFIATKGVDLTDEDVRVSLSAAILATVVIVVTAMLIAHQGRRRLEGGALGVIVALGLIPVTIWAVTVPSKQELLIDPATRLMLYAPWLLAIVSACVFSAVALLIAWVVNYRPGAIAPVLAALFAVPVLLFEAEVGRDELSYRVLEFEYGPRSRRYFHQEDVKDRIVALAQQRWTHDPSLDVQALIANIELLWESEFEPLGELKRQESQHQMTALAADQYAVAEACDEFRQRRPHSRYIPNVLYIKARALDMRVDVPRFRRDGILTFYDDFPNPASQQTWETLLANYPESPLAGVALHRLAIFQLREQQVDAATEQLGQLVDRFDRPGGEQPPARGGLAEIFARKPPTSSLDVQLPSVVEQGRELLELMRANGNDAIHGALPIAELLQLDPRSKWYRQQLRVMLNKYARSLLVDNLRLRLALAAESLSRRIGSLQDLIREYPRGDALPEAMYRLGELLEADARPEEARLAYGRVGGEYAGSVWARRAARRLAQLELRVVQP
ncbi:MAG TPA: tetratricopeptide repeat protein [Phycisphaerae bacterium]|nr:tetratricopeptide repeat protein [Phycisphaerae bacterium]